MRAECGLLVSMSRGAGDVVIVGPISVVSAGLRTLRPAVAGLVCLS
jgi:hypothetical protein